MNQPHSNGNREKFEPSEAALDEYYASRRRYIRPVLVFLPIMFLFLAIRKYQVPALILLGVGSIAFFVMIWRNAIIAVRADRRLKAEKREWDAKQAQAGPAWGPGWKHDA